MKPKTFYVTPKLYMGAGLAMAHGDKKYGEGEPRQSRSIADRWDSLQRHLMAWREGEHDDPESGLNHLYHAASQLAFLIEADEEMEREVHEVLGERSGAEEGALWPWSRMYR